MTVAQLARWWRRGQPWRAAARCEWCGWTPADRGGVVRGRHDVRFTGHAPGCAVALFGAVHTAEQVADQFAAIACWAYATRDLGMPYQAEWWRMVTAALVWKADAIGAPVPVPDTTAELRYL